MGVWNNEKNDKEPVMYIDSIVVYAFFRFLYAERGRDIRR